MNKHTAFQIAMSLLIAAFLILWPLVAGAQTWDRCWRISHGQVCIARAQRITRITCDWGWQPQFTPVPRCVVLEVKP